MEASLFGDIITFVNLKNGFSVPSGWKTNATAPAIRGFDITDNGARASQTSRNAFTGASVRHGPRATAEGLWRSRAPAFERAWAPRVQAMIIA